MSEAQAELKSMLHYAPDTGVFTWKVNRGNSPTVGVRAGGFCSVGYRGIRINGKREYEHRLAWLYMTGELPLEIDHINGDKSDNRWCNLRQANRSKNMSNVGARVTNTSGIKGVTWRSDRQCWRVNVKGDSGIHTSNHKCLLDAVSCAVRLQKILHGDFNHTP